MLLLSGLLTMIVLKVGAGRAVRAYGRTLAQLKFAILTVMAVLALGFVMNESGQTTTLGLWMAGAGGLFALLSPILGWLGVAVTGVLPRLSGSRPPALSRAAATRFALAVRATRGRPLVTAISGLFRHRPGMPRRGRPRQLSSPGPATGSRAGSRQ